MTAPSPRAEPRAAAPDLIVLQLAEDFAAWLLPRSMRWPKHARLSLTARIESLCLDVSASTSSTSWCRPVTRPPAVSRASIT